MWHAQINAHKLTAIDIFAGGGGLSVGLKKAGFQVVSSVEIEPHAYATYRANHPEVRAYKQDIRTVSGAALKSSTTDGEVDLLAGCPPCQGFTSLTSKYRREDNRNELIGEMGRLVTEIRPRAIMMENVPGLVQKGKRLFDTFVSTLTDLGYEVKWDVLQVADFGIPQSRRRLVLLAGRGFGIDLPKATHSRGGAGKLLPWKTLRDVLSPVQNAEPIEFSRAKEMGGAHKFNWHVVRSLSYTNMERLKATKPGATWRDLPSELRPPCHRERNSGFANVYGRMTWDQVPVTITGGFATLSKGRFGHPEQNRTISVREAALIQTFPEDYVFDSPYIDYVCDIIGNALPCDFASIVAAQCADALDRMKNETA